MAALILPSRRVVQPQGPVAVDSGNRLSRGLLVVNTPTLGRRNLIDGKESSFESGTIGQQAIGEAYQYTGNTAGRAWSVSGLTALTLHTIFDARQSGNRLFNAMASGANQTLYWEPNTATIQLILFNGGYPVLVDTGIAKSSFGVGSLSVAATSSGYEAYVNGKPAGSTTSNVLSFSDINEIGFNYRQAGTAFPEIIAGAVFGAAWNRALCEAEIAELHANPWQLFSPIQRRIWVPVAAGAVSHDTSGALANAGGTTTGAADSSTARASSGALANAGGATAGTAARTRQHPATGALANPGAQTVGAAARTAAPVSHDTSGVLSGPGAVVVGLASNESGILIDTHDGFWAKEWARIRAREKRKYREEIEERVEEIQDEIAEVEQQIAEVKQVPKPKKATPARDFYAEQARIVEHLIARRNQLIEEEDEELLLLL